MKRPIDRYVDSLLRRRRPKPFAPTEDEVAIARTAIALAAADREEQRPRAAFVEELRQRLAAGERTDPAGRPEPDDRPAARAAKPARRRILTATALTATGAAGIVAGHELTLRDVAPAVAAPDELTPDTGSWQNVIANADLQEGAVVSFDLGSVTGFVRRSSGRVQAVSGICTHQGCRLALNPARDHFTCPCHGATFTLTGASATHPRANGPLPALPRLPVRIDQGHIQVYAPPATPAGSWEL